jgi:hypothetical protein
MSKKISEISLKTMFECENYSCQCVKDIINVALDEAPKVTLKLYSDMSRPLLFSYVAKAGLTMTGKAGGVIEGNILSKLLSIPNGDVDKHVDFFEKYGFLFPLPSNEYTSIDADALMEIVNRIKATIRLYNAINKKNYKGILVNVVYLLYSPIIQIELSDFIFSTCHHEFSKLLESYNLFPDLNTVPEVFAKGTYSVEDTFLSRNNHVDIDFYNKVRSGANTTLQGSNDSRFKNLMAMYIGCRDANNETRTLIDFFYHFQTEVSVFKEVRFGRIIPYTHIDESAFSIEIKNSLLKVAKIVVAEEINHNIRGIHPRYNGGKLTASWQVDNLIEALYFSIFYMNTGEIYKECENPNCKHDRFFLVEATRSNKHYCCEKCRNAASAQRHRNRKLSK